MNAMLAPFPAHGARCPDLAGLLDFACDSANRPIDVRRAIAAPGMLNVTNQYTFDVIFQRAMGAKGDVPCRRRVVAEMVLRWLEPELDG